MNNFFLIRKQLQIPGKKNIFNKTFIFLLRATSSSKEHTSLLWRHDSCSKMHALLWRHNSCSKMHDQTVSMYDIILSTVRCSFLYHNIRMKVFYIITRTAIHIGKKILTRCKSVIYFLVSMVISNSFLSWKRNRWTFTCCVFKWRE